MLAKFLKMLQMYYQAFYHNQSTLNQLLHNLIYIYNELDQCENLFEDANFSCPKNHFTTYSTKVKNFFDINKYGISHIIHYMNEINDSTWIDKRNSFSTNDLEGFFGEYIRNMQRNTVFNYIQNFHRFRSQFFLHTHVDTLHHHERKRKYLKTQSESKISAEQFINNHSNRHKHNINKTTQNFSEEQKEQPYNLQRQYQITKCHKLRDEYFKLKHKEQSKLIQMKTIDINSQTLQETPFPNYSTVEVGELKEASYHSLNSYFTLKIIKIQTTAQTLFHSVDLIPCFLRGQYISGVIRDEIICNLLHQYPIQVFLHCEQNQKHIASLPAHDFKIKKGSSDIQAQSKYATLSANFKESVSKKKITMRIALCLSNYKLLSDEFYIFAKRTTNTLPWKKILDDQKSENNQ
jgi:hypothetical protein